VKGKTEDDSALSNMVLHRVRRRGNNAQEKRKKLQRR